MIKLHKNKPHPTKTIYLPRLNGVSLDTLALYENILFELDRIKYHKPALRKVKALLRELNATGSFKSGANRQAFLCLRLQVRAHEDKNTTSIAANALAAIRITFPAFDPCQYKQETLIYIDPQLIRVFAGAWAKIEPEAAIRLLQDTLIHIEQTKDEKQVKLLAPLTLELVQILRMQNNCADAFQFCEVGNAYSIKHNRGKYSPDFALYKAMIRDNKRDYMHAFFGYTALGRAEDAAKVKKVAAGAGHDFPTYNVETIEYVKPVFNMERGFHFTGNHPGEYIARFRTGAGLSQSELCEGICPRATLNKIESGTLPGTAYQLEALMERLGRYTDYYFDVYSSERVLNERKMRNEVRIKLATRQPEEAENLLNRLKTLNDYRKGLGKQFVLSVEAAIHAALHSRDDKYLALLTEAWQVTKKGCEIDDAYRHHLTYVEIVLLNQMAAYLCNNGQRDRAIRIFESIRRNLNYNCIDEMERMRTYIMVSNNMTTSLARGGNYAKVLEVVTEIENLCIKFGNLHQAYRLAGNKASALIGLAREDEATPYLALTYYGAELLGYEQRKVATQKYVTDENLDIVFI